MPIVIPTPAPSRLCPEEAKGRGHGSGRKTGLAFTQSDDLDKQDMSCHAKETAKKSKGTLKEGRTKRAKSLKKSP